LVRLERQRQAALGPHFQASRDGFPDVGKRFVAGFTLADAAEDGSNVVTNFMGLTLPSFLVFGRRPLSAQPKKNEP
jgi:hypothetical protein